MTIAAIEIKNPKGFWGKKSEIYNKLYTEKLFRKWINVNQIVIKIMKNIIVDVTIVIN